ncbi:MAG: flagellar hook-basal body complex protein FliE [Oscillospiraceae bacterium]|nr:flagellar hook-basal body complex protein FliE [Oscillospiraceae bacterium]MBR3537258.1 flagellar hook-basal body complex protein FliE [Oscillospiraceae bacterium]MBR6837266.1 flagellar hook-basal body complex protein FliE [Oscillospiraceae bacterium]MBR6925521.1 flagellar hook-basal body complex protein FliE [Oscillospiraceae bacterium]
MIREDFITPMSGMQAIKPMQFWGSGKTNVENDESEMSFGDTLRSKIQNVKDLEQKSLASAYDISMGNTEDIESAMIDATKASVAIETAVQVTTRAVNAYKEIIQMQI